MLILIFVMYCTISQCIGINFIDLPGFGDDELEYVETKDVSAENEMQAMGTNFDSDGNNEETDEFKDQKDEGAEKEIEFKDDKDLKRNNVDTTNETQGTNVEIGEHIDDVKETNNEMKDSKNETEDEFREDKDKINDNKDKSYDSKNEIKVSSHEVAEKRGEVIETIGEVIGKNAEESDKKDEVTETKGHVTEKKAAVTEKDAEATEKRDEVTQKNEKVTTAKNTGNFDNISPQLSGRRYWKVSAVPTTSTTASAWIPDKDENIKSKINSLVQQTMHDTEAKVKSVQKLQERHREKPAYRVGFILSMLKKSRDVLNQLFNIAVKHRDQWRALEQLKIFELIVHTNVDSTNLVRQLVEIHLIHVNNKNGNKAPNANPQLRSRVVLM